MEPNKTAGYWIEKLKLQAHPEGGYYHETFRSSKKIETPDFNGPRNIFTSIYFLLEGNEFSTFHRIKSDELWNFHVGSALTVHIIHPSGVYESIKIGDDPEKGELLQAVVPAGCWFGASCNHPDSYSLVGCVVAPGFDFNDFELASKDDLSSEYPQHREIIERMTR